MMPDRNTKEGEALHTLKVAAELRTHDVQFPTPNLHNHDWKQRGFTVHCDGIGHHNPHGFHLRHDQHLTGISPDGYPVIDNVVVAEPQNIA